MAFPENAGTGTRAEQVHGEQKPRVRLRTQGNQESHSRSERTGQAPGLALREEARAETKLRRLRLCVVFKAVGRMSSPG